MPANILWKIIVVVEISLAEESGGRDVGDKEGGLSIFLKLFKAEYLVVSFIHVCWIKYQLKLPWVWIIEILQKDIRKERESFK